MFLVEVLVDDLPPPVDDAADDAESGGWGGATGEGVRVGETDRLERRATGEAPGAALVRRMREFTEGGGRRAVGSASGRPGSSGASKGGRGEAGEVDDGKRGGAGEGGSEGTRRMAARDKTIHLNDPREERARRQTNDDEKENSERGGSERGSPRSVASTASEKEEKERMFEQKRRLKLLSYHAGALQNLALALFETGTCGYKEAEQLYLRAFDISEASGFGTGRNHTSLLDNMALLYLATKQWARANACATWHIESLERHAALGMGEKPKKRVMAGLYERVARLALLEGNIHRAGEEYELSLKFAGDMGSRQKSRCELGLGIVRCEEGLRRRSLKLIDSAERHFKKAIQLADAFKMEQGLSGNNDGRHESSNAKGKTAKAKATGSGSAKGGETKKGDDGNDVAELLGEALEFGAMFAGSVRRDDVEAERMALRAADVYAEVCSGGGGGKGGGGSVEAGDRELMERVLYLLGGVRGRRYLTPWRYIIWKEEGAE